VFAKVSARLAARQGGVLGTLSGDVDTLGGDVDMDRSGMDSALRSMSSRSSSALVFLFGGQFLVGEVAEQPHRLVEEGVLGRLLQDIERD